MNNNNIKRGRPKVFTEDEQRKKKTKLMLNEEWYCDVCNNNHNYTLAGKWNHKKTKKHIKNSNEQ